MEVWEIDQRELQKRGGLAVRYPVSSLISLLVDRVRGILKREKVNILDLTYGQGRFWVVPKNENKIELLVGVDIQVLDWHIKPDIFILKPLQKALPILKKLNIKFHIVVTDPPFYEAPFRGWEDRSHYMAAFGKPRFLVEESYRIAAALGAPFVICHFNKDRFETATYKHIIEVRFYPVFRRSTAIQTWFWLSRREGDAEKED